MKCVDCGKDGDEEGLLRPDGIWWCDQCFGKMKRRSGFIDEFEWICEKLRWSVYSRERFSWTILRDGDNRVYTNGEVVLSDLDDFNLPEDSKLESLDMDTRKVTKKEDVEYPPIGGAIAIAQRASHRLEIPKGFYRFLKKFLKGDPEPGTAMLRFSRECAEVGEVDGPPLRRYRRMGVLEGLPMDEILFDANIFGHLKPKAMRISDEPNQPVFVESSYDRTVDKVRNVVLMPLVFRKN